MGSIKGQASNRRKLEPEDITKIRSAFKDHNMSMTGITKLFRQYNLSVQTVSDIVNYKTYKDVK